MLSEPMLITYDGVTKSFNRVSYGDRASGSPALFVTSDGEFELSIRQSKLTGGVRTVEVSLSRTEQDADGDPFTGSWSALPNRYGIIFETNHLGYNSTTDLPNLQTALNTLVDATFRSRLLGGES